MVWYSETKEEGRAIVYMCFPPFRRPTFSTLTKRMFSCAIFCREKKIILFNSELEKASLSWKFYALSGKIDSQTPLVTGPFTQSFFLSLALGIIFRAVSHFILKEHHSSNTESWYSQKAALLSHILQHCDEVMKSSFLITSHTLIF